SCVRGGGACVLRGRIARADPPRSGAGLRGGRGQTGRQGRERIHELTQGPCGADVRRGAMKYYLVVLVMVGLTVAGFMTKRSSRPPPPPLVAEKKSDAV